MCDSSIAWRIHFACWASRLACDVPGDFLEIGCYEGYTASVLRGFLANDLLLVREGGGISGSIAFLAEALKRSVFLIKRKALISVKEGPQDLQALKLLQVMFWRLWLEVVASLRSSLLLFNFI